MKPTTMQRVSVIVAIVSTMTSLILAFGTRYVSAANAAIVSDVRQLQTTVAEGKHRREMLESDVRAMLPIVQRIDGRMSRLEIQVDELVKLHIKP